MKAGDEITLDQVNKLKNYLYKQCFSSEKFSKLGTKWWARKKKSILKNTRFKIVSIANCFEDEK